MSALKEELVHQAQRRKRLGFTNYWLSNGMLLVAVVCSLFPTLNQAIPETYRFSTEWTPLISAVPAAIILLLTVFRFEEKQNYHWLYARRTKLLIRKLRDQNAEIKQVSEEYNALTTELGEKYPGSSVVAGFRGNTDT